MFSSCIFSSLDNNLSIYQWIFTSGICIDIVEIWFGFTLGQIFSIFDRANCLPDNERVHVLSFHFLSPAFLKKSEGT